MKKLFTLIFTTATYLCSAQQAFYDVLAGQGNGIRFWNGNDSYKIHMGSASEYFYGPVTDYSIKTNMSGGTPGRGWTWGVAGQVPVVAINTLGNMQIAGTFTSSNLLTNVNSNNPGLTVSGHTSSSGTPDIYINRANSSTVVGNAPGIQLSDLGSGSHNIIQSSSGGLQFFSWVGGSWTESMRLTPTGNVGIGTSSPSSLLHLNSASSILQVQSSGSTNYAAINLINDSGIPGVSMASFGSAYPTGSAYARPNGVGIFTTSNAGASAGIAIAARNPSGYITFHSGGNTERLRILANGNIGIGTTVPDAMLSVSGQVHAQEVKVSVTVPGPDYVFEKDYKLSSLEEIKNYIDQNKHLSEVPSAKEMEKNGVQLGEMNMLLLKKIEELTLHMIEQQNEIKNLKSEMAVLKNKN